MFFKIFAVLLMLPTVAWADVNACNAFHSTNGMDTPCPYAAKNSAKAASSAHVTAPCAVGDPNCGPVFSRNSKCFGDDCGPIFKRNEGCDNCEPEQKEYVKNYTPVVNLDFNDVHRECKDYAPIYFQYVDFRLKKESRFDNYVNKLGNYRFRIFGCRRNDKEMFLNVGRTMQKDMHFFDIFNNVYGDCMSQVKMPANLCDEKAITDIPEYILTAEIVDYAMNVCDEFDWKKAEDKELRSGSSEMTVVWRLMDPTKQTVFWKGQSTGYGELENGERDGEVLLVDRAFEDALRELRYLEGFEKQITTRQGVDEKNAYKKMLADLEKVINPANCVFEEEVVEVATIEDRYDEKGCPICKECNTCEVGKNAFVIAEKFGADAVGRVVVEDEGMAFDGYSVKCEGDNCGKIYKKYDECTTEDCRQEVAENYGFVSDGTMVADSGDMKSGGYSARCVGDNCGPIFKRNEGCDSFICRLEVAEKFGAEAVGKVVLEDSGMKFDGYSIKCEGDNCGKIYKEYDICKTDDCRTKVAENYGFVSDGAMVADSGDMQSDGYSAKCVGDNCGPIFKRNEGCTTAACKAAEIETADGRCVGDNCGPIFKRNEGCTTAACKAVEASGMDVFGNVDNVRVVDAEWVDLPMPVERRAVAESAFIQSAGNFCIENELAHKVMDPFNVYKTRAAIVDISSASGKKGVGLIVNDQFILTSADLIDNPSNKFKVKTINGVEFDADGFRYSPKKNVALLLSAQKMEYTPLSLELKLPPVGATGFMTLGMNLEEGGGEGYVDDNTKITGYRFSEDKGAEIITNQHTQNLTVGGALVDNKGNIYGVAHYGQRINKEPDMYMPIETALKSMNLELCGRKFLNQEPWKKSTLEKTKTRAPKEMNIKNRK